MSLLRVVQDWMLTLPKLSHYPLDENPPFMTLGIDYNVKLGIMVTTGYPQRTDILREDKYCVIEMKSIFKLTEF